MVREIYPFLSCRCFRGFKINNDSKTLYREVKWISLFHFYENLNNVLHIFFYFSDARSV